jgi:hypothetical protein
MDRSREVVTMLSLLDFVRGNILSIVQECKVHCTRGGNGYCFNLNSAGIRIVTGNAYIDIESLYVILFPKARCWTVPQPH